MKIAIHDQYSEQIIWNVNNIGVYVMSKLLALTTCPTLKLPLISKASQRLNILDVTAYRGYDCCGLLGVPECLKEHK